MDQELVFTNLRRLAATAAPTESVTPPFYTDVAAVMGLGLILFIISGTVVCIFEMNQKKARRQRRERFLKAYGMEPQEYRKNSRFYQENGHTWDFVIVLKTVPVPSSIIFSDKFYLALSLYVEGRGKEISCQVHHRSASVRVDSPQENH